MNCTHSSSFFFFSFILHGILRPKISVRVRVRVQVHVSSEIIDADVNTATTKCFRLNNIRNTNTYTLYTVCDIRTYVRTYTQDLNNNYHHKKRKFMQYSELPRLALVHSRSILCSHNVTWILVCRHFCSCLESFCCSAFSGSSSSSVSLCGDEKTLL